MIRLDSPGVEQVFSGWRVAGSPPARWGRLGGGRDAAQGKAGAKESKCQRAAAGWAGRLCHNPTGRIAFRRNERVFKMRTKVSLEVVVREWVSSI